MKVRIFNWNCLNNKKNLVLAPDNSGKLELQENSDSNQAQEWELIPNLVLGAAAGGFSLMNEKIKHYAEQPVPGTQVLLGDDPTPYGSKVYCWTLWPVGEVNGEQLWTIQEYNRGRVMDAKGASIKPNTEILFWDFNGGDNQKWIIRKID